jgi:DNA-binding transcriptional regulator YdaS (Cro superfamily)
VLLGHYGAVRGLNTMSAVDALITIGDPWPNLGDVRNDAAFLALDNADARIEAFARAELEQAHGRLRAIHRTRPARALHVGSLLPSGIAWTSGVNVRRMPLGRPPTASTMPPDEAARLVAALGGTSAAAQALGCGLTTVKRYVTGARTAPPAVSGKLRLLAIGVSGPGVPGNGGPETPIKYPSIGVSGPLPGNAAIGVSGPVFPGTPGNTPVAQLIERLGGVRATARRLGLGLATVSRYASGERVPDDVTLARMRESATSGTGGPRGPLAGVARIALAVAPSAPLSAFREAA